MDKERIRSALAKLTAILRDQVDGWSTRKCAKEIDPSQRPTPQVVTQRLTRLLEDNLLPFWYPDVVDEIHGGYRLHHDQHGVWLGTTPKGLVGQARTLWFFSRLVKQYPDHRGYREAADYGFAFLQNHLWDPLHGGFFWEVAIEASEAQTTSASEEHTTHARTSTTIKAGKHLYGQAFGLYALSAYAQATANSAAKALASELFALFEANAYDRVHGGYHEFLQRNWEPVADTEIDYRSNTTPAQKTQDTHLHLLEGLTAYVELISDGQARNGQVHRRQAHDDLAKARLTELIITLTSTVQRPAFGVATDVHLPSWQPKLSPAHAQVIYGHELEKIWLLTRACHAVNLSPALLVSQFRGWFSVAYDKAFDQRKDGFFERGYLGRSAHARNKIWWTQAEGMLAAMQMYRHTGDLHYYAVFCRLLDWIENTQADWVSGDWHRIITLTDEVQGNKADNWKTPYHNGRALLECLHLLSQIEPDETAHYSGKH